MSLAVGKMEGPVARIVARSLSRWTKHRSSSAIATSQRCHLWTTSSRTKHASILLPSASLVSRRDFSHNNSVFNQTKKDLSTSEDTVSADGSKTGQVPMEKAPENPVVKLFNSSYEESSVGKAFILLLLLFSLCVLCSKLVAVLWVYLMVFKL